MAVVSNVVMRYSAKGARSVQRANERVQDSIEDTAETARKQTGSIQNWMRSNKTAIMGLGAATAAAVGVLISQSPVLTAELSKARLGFELLAMEITRNFAPVFREISDLVFDVYEAFKALPDQTQGVISWGIGLAGIFGGLAVAIGGLESILSGTAIGSALASIGSGIAGLATGPIALIVGAIAGLAAAWATNFGGIRDVAGGVISYLVQRFGDVWSEIQKTISVITSAFGPGGRAHGVFSFFENLFSKIFDTIGILLKSWIDMVGTIVETFAQIFRGDIGGALKTVKQYFSRELGRIMNILNTWGIIDFFTNLSGKLVSAGKSILTSLLKGLKSGWSSVTSWIMDKVGWIADKLNKLPGINIGVGKGGGDTGTTKGVGATGNAYSNRYSRGVTQNTGAAIGSRGQARQMISNQKSEEKTINNNINITQRIEGQGGLYEDAREGVRGVNDELGSRANLRRIE